MGWGILFLAYFLAFFVPVPPLSFIGLSLAAWALYKLKDYRTGFMTAIYWLIPLALCVLYEVVMFAFMVAPYLGIVVPELAWTGVVTVIVMLIKFTLILCFHFVLLRNLRAFAAELELPGIAKRAGWGLWLVSVQCSCYIVAMLLELIGWPLDPFSALSVLLQFVWAIFNMINIFTCYMYICPEGDEEMERKPSRFAFVNAFRAKMDERDRAAREREAQRQQSKQQKHNDKKKRKK